MPLAENLLPRRTRPFAQHPFRTASGTAISQEPRPYNSADATISACEEEHLFANWFPLRHGRTRFLRTHKTATSRIERFAASSIPRAGHTVGFRRGLQPRNCASRVVCGRPIDGLATSRNRRDEGGFTSRSVAAARMASPSRVAAVCFGGRWSAIVPPVWYPAVWHFRSEFVIVDLWMWKRSIGRRATVTPSFETEIR